MAICRHGCSHNSIILVDKFVRSTLNSKAVVHKDTPTPTPFAPPDPVPAAPASPPFVWPPCPPPLPVPGGFDPEDGLRILLM